MKLSIVTHSSFSIIIIAKHNLSTVPKTTPRERNIFISYFFIEKANNIMIILLEPDLLIFLLNSISFL